MSGRNLKSPATQMFSPYPDVWHRMNRPPFLPSQEALNISAVTSGLREPALPGPTSRAPSRRLPTPQAGNLFSLNLYTWMTGVTRSRFLKAVEAVISKVQCLELASPEYTQQAKKEGRGKPFSQHTHTQTYVTLKPRGFKTQNKTSKSGNKGCGLTRRRGGSPRGEPPPNQKNTEQLCSS